MSFVIFTDSSSNLTPDLTKEWDIQVIPLYIRMADGSEHACFGEDMDLHAFYNELRAHKIVHTSMINSATFSEAFEPVLKEGRDILYIAMSSGISGTAFAAKTAAEELAETYPERKVVVVDTLGASFGEGLFALECAKMRAAGESLETCAKWCEGHIPNMNQFLMVDDLVCIKNGGRISGIVALAGTILRLKPVLFGNPEGKFSIADKSLGRKKSLKFLSDICLKRIRDHKKYVIGIAHADCEADAELVMDAIREKLPDQQFLVRCYEPGTGAHTGADALAIFFFGDDRSTL